MRTDLPGFADRVALVTGSSRGIGRGIAELFGGQGARVVVNSAGSPVDGRLVARSIREAGGRAVYVRADVGLEEHVAELAALVRERFGRLDVLVHCAAGGAASPIAEAGYDKFERAMRINSYSLIALARHLGPLMPRGGKVLYLSSMGSIMATPGGYGLVGAAKAASEALVRSLAHEFADRGISVNALRTTAVRTLSLRYFATADAFLKIAREEAPMGAPPLLKVAETALLLCTPAADYVTGQVVNVDGGWLSSLHRPDLFGPLHRAGGGHRASTTPKGER
ncbi:SDR family oxidoreductase [Actinosynnema sp. NPDC023587]|uniref:SDR family NAD(P)-dependent oxidoreductase n=1 Tax=Actinosynnema sp. NPDC023587 TaxID=3154695 RepID=UPI00341156A8